MGATAAQQPRTCCHIKLDRFIAIMTGTQVVQRNLFCFLISVRSQQTSKKKAQGIVGNLGVF